MTPGDMFRKFYMAVPFLNRWITSKLHGLAWLSRFSRWKRSHPCRSFDRTGLHAHVLECLGPDETVDFLEFGVAAGHTFKWFAAHHRNPQSRLVGFDTFTGLPRDWEWAEAGTFSTQGQAPSIEDPRCSFVKGLFQNTLLAFLSTFGSSRRKIVHLDADLYSSTLFVLITLGPVLKPGDILIFDEMSSYLGEFRAFSNFLEAFPIKYEVMGSACEYAQIALKVV